MSSVNLYKAITKADQENTDGGYKNVVMWAPRETFLALQTPIAIPLVLGDKFLIPTTHTFIAVDEGFISWLCKLDSVQITGATVGDAGANLMEYTTVFTLLGDGASTHEQVTELLNADNIWLLKDSSCLAGAPYVQMGDECLSPVADVAFDSKTTKDGMKEWTIKLVGRKKYFYSGTITLKP